MYLKTNDEVIVISGKDKGKVGRISKILPNNKVIVEGIAMVKKHQKSNNGIDGGIIEKERAIDASNVSLFDPKTKKPSRVRIEQKDGKKTRVLVKTNKEVK